MTASRQSVETYVQGAEQSTAQRRSFKRSQMPGNKEPPSLGPAARSSPPRSSHPMLTGWHPRQARPCMPHQAAGQGLHRLRLSLFRNHRRRLLPGRRSTGRSRAASQRQQRACMPAQGPQHPPLQRRRLGRGILEQRPLQCLSGGAVRHCIRSMMHSQQLYHCLHPSRKHTAAAAAGHSKLLAAAAKKAAALRCRTVCMLRRQRGPTPLRRTGLECLKQQPRYASHGDCRRSAEAPLHLIMRPVLTSGYSSVCKCAAQEMHCLHACWLLLPLLKADAKWKASRI